MNKRVKNLFSLLCAIIILFTSILFMFDHTHFAGFGPAEDKDFLTKLFHRLYFVVCAMSGMGYGDVSPATMSVKGITMVMQCMIILSVFSELFKF
jgi:hypothetical protein